MADKLAKQFKVKRRMKKLANSERRRKPVVSAKQIKRATK